MVSFSFVIISSSFNGTVENPTFAWMFFQNNADISFKILNDSPPPSYRVKNLNFIGLGHFNTFNKYTRKFLKNLSNVVLWLRTDTFYMRIASFYLLVLLMFLINTGEFNSVCTVRYNCVCTVRFNSVFTAGFYSVCTVGLYAGFTAGLILSVL